MESRITELTIKYFNRTITADEFTELEEWISTSDDNKQLFNATLSTHKKIAVVNYANENVENRINKNKFELRTKLKARRRVMFIRSVAAVLAIGIVSGSFFMLLNRIDKTVADTISDTTKTVAEYIILKPSNKGIVLMESNREINIKDSVNKYLHGNVKIEKNSIDYSQLSDSTINVISTIFIPKGERFKLTLSDGTKVWINSNTEIEYPSVFNGDTRRIKVKGEVFLEVSHNPNRPFIVETFNSEIKVLGTKFNVSAYPESINVVTTLLEGSVLVNNNNLLSPNEQLSLNKHTNKSSLVKVDASYVVDWINGIYRFDNITLADLIVLFNRVYGVEIEVKNPQSLKRVFTGSIHVSIECNEMFQMIMKTANIEYVLEKSKITIW